ncbi:MAG: AAA family ATPase [Pseudomonadota bacterium]
MYEPYYGLLTKPFTLVPDPRFIYWAGPHSMAFAMLEYGIVNHAGFTVITGEVGAGKTTLIQYLLSKLPGDINVGLLSNTGGGGELLQWVLMAFDQDFESEARVKLFKQFKDYLVSQYDLGKRTILIVDEAQNLGSEALEELRMLSNINSHNRELLQIVLSGQPELKTLLAAPSLRQFAQRVSSDFHLSLLGQQDIEGYIEHRLSVAGAKRQLFTKSACDMIYFATQGTPRLINTLCDTALLYGFAEESKEITSEIVKRVLDDKRRFGVFTTPVGSKLSVAN